MSVQDSTNPPKFYMDYVNDIQNKIEADADYEFACIWLEHLRTGKHRFVLTDDVSDKINDMNHFIAESDLYQNDRIKRNVLSLAIPDKLLELVGLEQCIQRVPDAYLKSIFATYLASRYIYENGLASNEFAFFKFMQQFSQE